MPRARESIDESTLKTAIQQKLRNNGVYDDITAHIRSSLLLSLRNPSETKKPKDGGIENVAWQSLIYHFLNEREFVHTLSVFAAECGLENGNQKQFSVEESMKVLGLGNFYAESQKSACEEGISALLGVVAKLSSSHSAVAVQERQTITVSVQTETVSPVASPRGKKNEHTNYNGNQPSNSIEYRLQQLESELRHEMDEKLKISAKKQAINAMKRVEQRHRDEMNSLRKQFELERERVKQIDNDWTEKLAREQHSMEKERIDMNKKYERLVLEKDTLESELALMVEFKKQQHRDWSKQQGEIEEQKRCLQSEMNKILLHQDAMKATEVMCASLRDEKDDLLNQTQLLRKQLASVLNARDALHQSCAKLKADHVKMSQEHRIKENSLQRAKAQVESQLIELQEKYDDAVCDLGKNRLQLERTKNEVASLRSLLRQSQTALESVTFRDEAPCYHPSKVSRSSIGAYCGTASSLKQTRCLAPSSFVQSAEPKALSKEQGEVLSTQEGDGLKSDEGDTTAVCQIDSPCNLAGPKDPPLWSPKDPPDSRSTSGSHHERLDVDSRILFRRKTTNTDKSIKKPQTPVESIVNDQADDISAISEAISRHGHILDRHSAASASSSKSNDEVPHDDVEDLQYSSSNNEGTETDKAPAESVPTDEDEDIKVLNTTGSLHNHSAASITSSMPNTTTYSESFHSELDEEVAASKMTEPVKDVEPIEPTNSERSTPEPSNSPRSISSQSDGGYTCSFCTEE